MSDTIKRNDWVLVSLGLKSSGSQVISGNILRAATDQRFDRYLEEDAVNIDGELHSYFSRRFTKLHERPIQNRTTGKTPPSQLQV